MKIITTALLGSTLVTLALTAPAYASWTQSTSTIWGGGSAAADQPGYAGWSCPGIAQFGINDQGSVTPRGGCPEPAVFVLETDRG